MKTASQVSSPSFAPHLWRWLALVGLLTTVVTGPLAAADSSPDAANLFRYDDRAPFVVQDLGVERRGAVTLRDITFAGAGDPIRAYLVSPDGRGPFAGVLYVHWLGEPSTSNRTEFLSEAIGLAAKGTVALLVDAMWSQPGWYEKRVPEEDYERSIRQVVELRRAMDLLASQPGVDPARIAFVGHDFGAMYGALMGAADRRPHTYVLMAGTRSFIDWYLYAAQPADLPAYKQRMVALDPVRFVGSLEHASVFFQFAAADEYVSGESALASYAAAHPRKVMATYFTDHSLVGTDVAADRESWLTRELGLGDGAR